MGVIGKCHICKKQIKKGEHWEYWSPSYESGKTRKLKQHLDCKNPKKKWR